MSMKHAVTIIIFFVCSVCFSQKLGTILDTIGAEERTTRENNYKHMMFETAIHSLNAESIRKFQEVVHKNNPDLAKSFEEYLLLRESGYRAPIIRKPTTNELKAHAVVVRRIREKGSSIETHKRFQIHMALLEPDVSDPAVRYLLASVAVTSSNSRIVQCWKRCRERAGGGDESLPE